MASYEALFLKCGWNIAEICKETAIHTCVCIPASFSLHKHVTFWIQTAIDG